MMGGHRHSELASMTMKLLFRIALCGLLLIGYTSCQSVGCLNLSARAKDSSDLSERLAAIEAAVERERQDAKVPGLALVVVKDDRVVLLKGFGLRNVEEKLPVTPETLFPIGSCTKTFTALAALISQDEGKLSLDDSPKRFLPYFNLRDPEADAQATLGDLLSHRTGLKEHGGDDAWADGARSREEVIRIAIDGEPGAGFRKKFQYNNVMYIAAGEAIAGAQNSTYEAVITSRVLDPLGMIASNFSLTSMQESKDFAWGYNNEGNHERMALHLPGTIAAAGGVISNAKEMGQWLRLLLGGGAIDGKRVVSERGFETMLVNRAEISKDTSYCMGLYVRECEDWPGHPIYYHRGNITGFNVEFFVIPDQKLGFAVLTNIRNSRLPRETLRAVIANLGTAP
jgi:CubicO group peptidase (beta-lactamase class C family)